MTSNCIDFCSYYHGCWLLQSYDGWSRIEFNIDSASLDASGDVINVYDGKLCHVTSQYRRL